MKLEEEIKQTQFESQHQKMGINLLFTYNWYKDKLQCFFKPFGITMQQFNVLRILRGQQPKPLSACDIRERLLDKGADTPRIVTRMIKEGWVQKEVNPADRRLINVSITEAGLALLKDIDKEMQKMYDLFEHFSDEEANRMNELFDKMREHQEKMPSC